MHPVLFEIGEFPAWIAAALALVLGGVFALLGRRPKDGGKADSGSLWLAAACGIGAVALVANFGFSGPLGPLPIRWFGILVVSGFLLAAKAVAMRNVSRGLLDGEESFDLAFHVLLWGLAGSRMLHVFQHTEEFKGEPLKILKIWDGGLVWYGGAVAGALFVWYSLAKRGKDLWAVSDSFALALPLGHAVGGLGCFLAGCDYGKMGVGGREAVPWAVNFPNPTTPEGRYTLVPLEYTYDMEKDAAVWIHPTQLYLFLVNLLTFGILLWVDRRMTKGAFRGRLVALYLVLYAIGRGTVEHWRGDVDRGEYFDGAVSFSQIVSVFVLVAGVMMYRGLRKRDHRAAA